MLPFLLSTNKMYKQNMTNSDIYISMSTQGKALLYSTKLSFRGADKEII